MFRTRQPKLASSSAVEGPPVDTIVVAGLPAASVHAVTNGNSWQKAIREAADAVGMGEGDALGVGDGGLKRVTKLEGDTEFEGDAEDPPAGATAGAKPVEIA